MNSVTVQQILNLRQPEHSVMTADAVYQFLSSQEEDKSEILLSGLSEAERADGVAAPSSFHDLVRDKRHFQVAKAYEDEINGLISKGLIILHIKDS